jgi:DNA-binding transcriptional MocR family regulator
VIATVGAGKTASGGAVIGTMAAQWAKDRELMDQASTINMGIGMPAAEAIPKKELLASIQRGAFADDGDGAPPDRSLSLRAPSADSRSSLAGATDNMWGYDGSQGYQSLREGMAAHFTAVRGVPCTADHFLIDGGGGGAIATVAQTFLNPGDVVIAERPGYMGVMDCFVEQHARLVGVPLDVDGMKLEVLEGTINTLIAEGSTPKLLYLQALFHNPRGQCYTKQRMIDLLALCGTKNATV